ncbi:MAG: hypothetical protein EOP34_07485 [Rickettsiales bacterium]|nr:MAG: hypothetical protein EOP34_07485 [Rickettsiales bacterium]
MTIILSRSTDSIFVENESIKQIEIRKSDYIIDHGIIPTIGNILVGVLGVAFYYYNSSKKTDIVTEHATKSMFSKFTSSVGSALGYVAKTFLVAEYSYDIYSDIKEAKSHIEDYEYYQAIGSIAKAMISAGGIYVTFTQSHSSIAIVRTEIELINNIYNSWSNVYEEVSIGDGVNTW